MKSNNLTEPKKILFINEKGGVGKTTLVDEMCFEAEAKGIPYSLHNLDPQGTLLHEPHNSEGAWLDFIDTPGRLQEKVKDYMNEADVIVIPTDMTQNCMSSLTLMIGLARVPQADGKAVLVVLNRWDGGIACEEFQEWFNRITDNGGDITKSIPGIQISRSVNFANARMYGQSVHQYRRRCKSAKEIEELFFYILEAADLYDRYMMERKQK